MLARTKRRAGILWIAEPARNAVTGVFLPVTPSSL